MKKFLVSFDGALTGHSVQRAENGIDAMRSVESMFANYNLRDPIQYHIREVRGGNPFVESTLHFVSSYTGEEFNFMEPRKIISVIVAAFWRFRYACALI
jgi:hypothetical protein